MYAAASSDCVALLLMDCRISRNMSKHSAMFFICSAGDGSDSSFSAADVASSVGVVSCAKSSSSVKADVVGRLA